jgi:hypothetical protein
MISAGERGVGFDVGFGPFAIPVPLLVVILHHAQFHCPMRPCCVACKELASHVGLHAFECLNVVVDLRYSLAFLGLPL